MRIIAILNGENAARKHRKDYFSDKSAKRVRLVSLTYVVVGCFPLGRVRYFTAGPSFKRPNFEARMRMKLTSYRRKDQVHLLDLLGVGLIDATWPARLPTPLADRLQ